MTGATAAFIVLAKMHRDNPEANDFGYAELLDTAEVLDLGPTRETIYQHLSQHNVANTKASPDRYRMFYRPSRGRVRLLEPGDPIDATRDGAKFPDESAVDPRYVELVKWAKQRYSESERKPSTIYESLLSLYGSGKELWAVVHADAYIERIREGWE